MKLQCCNNIMVRIDMNVASAALSMYGCSHCGRRLWTRDNAPVSLEGVFNTVGATRRHRANSPYADLRVAAA